MRRCSPDPVRNVTGLTLIEVLVAVVILSVGIVAVLRGFNTALLALAVSRDALCADGIIAERLASAEIEAQSLDKLPVGLTGGMVDLPFGRFRWERRVDQTGGAWPEDSGGQQSLTRTVKVSVLCESSDRLYQAATYVRLAPVAPDAGGDVL